MQDIFHNCYKLEGIHTAVILALTLCAFTQVAHHSNTHWLTSFFVVEELLNLSCCIHFVQSLCGQKYSSHIFYSILGTWCNFCLFVFFWQYSEGVMQSLYSGLCYCRQSLVLWTSAHRNHVTPSTLIDMEHCSTQPRCCLTLIHIYTPPTVIQPS